MKKKINKCNTVIIVHGKSELNFVKYVRKNLRIKIEEHSDNKIQINDLVRIINGKPFSTKNYFEEHFDAKLNDKFKLFIIMDTDDCTPDDKRRFISKEIFPKTFLKKYIIPIYLSENFEDVFNSIGFNLDPKDKPYEEEFPTQRGENSVERIISIKDSLKTSSKTNLDDFLEFCIELYNINRISY